MFRKTTRARRSSTAVMVTEALERRQMLSATVVEHDGIAYLASTDSARVERYDLDAEAWLSSVDLTGGLGAPSVVHVDADGIYAAYGKAVYRYAADGSGQTHLMNSQYDVAAIHTDGSLLFVNFSGGRYTRMASFDKQSNMLLNTTEQHVNSINSSWIVPQTNYIVGTRSGSPSDVTYVSYTESGEFGNVGDGPYHGEFPRFDTIWLSPSSFRIVDEGGTVYATHTLARVGSLGVGIDEVAFASPSEPIVLRGDQLTAYSSALLPVGMTTLDHVPSEVFVNSTNVVTMTVEAGNYVARVVPRSELVPPVAGDAVDPRGLAFTPNQVDVTTDGTVLLFSSSQPSLFRWSTATQDYLDSIPLIGNAAYMAYDSAADTVYLAYEGGLIRAIDLSEDAPVERPFAVVPDTAYSMIVAGDYLLVQSFGRHYSLDPNGSQVDSADARYSTATSQWSDLHQQVFYVTTSGSPRDLRSLEFNADGVTYPAESAGGIGRDLHSPLHNSYGFVGPVNVAPDDSVILLGSGFFHDPNSLARLPLALLNDVSDAAWLGGQLITIRTVDDASEYQRWSTSTYELLGSAQRPGSAHALLTVSDKRVLGISIGNDGVPLFTLMDDSLFEPRLSISVDGSLLREDGGQLIATVTRNSGTSGDLEVTLISDGTDEATVPDSVVIPDGSESTTFLVSPVNDGLVDGDQIVNLIARAADHTRGTAEVEVLDANVAPIILDQTFDFPEDSRYGDEPGIVAAQDPNVGQTLTYEITAGNDEGHFFISPNSGDLAYWSNEPLDFETNPQIQLTVTVTDDGVAPRSSAATVTINVTNVNEPPILMDRDFSISENRPPGTIVGRVTATDSDAGDTLTYVRWGGDSATWFDVVPETGDVIVHGRPDHEFRSEVELIVGVRDAAGLHDTATVTIHVNDNTEADDVFGRASNGTTVVLESDGTQFVPRYARAAGEWSGMLPTDLDWDDLLVGDFTGDGLDDLAGRSPSDGYWRLLEATPDGFLAPRLWGFWSTGVSWQDVLVGDFNGDNKDDVLGRASTGTWVAGLSDGTYLVPTVFGGWSTAVIWHDVQTADLNGDGRTDVVGRASTGTWVAGISDGSRFAMSVYGAWSTAVEWTTVRIADVNGDGKSDLLGRASSGTWVAGISEAGRFSMSVFGGWSTAVQWHDVQVADLNGDGRDDVVGRSSSGRIVVGLSTGTRFEMAIWTNWSPAVEWTMVIGDFNRDGMADLAGRASTGSWYVSLSEGTLFRTERWGGWSTLVDWDTVRAGDFV